MDLPAHNRASDNVHIVPDGLQQLMSDISREVLRNQPEDLYKFISEYLEDLMKYRCLPHRFYSLEGYETFSSDTPSSINSYETFTPSSSDVTGYETFSSSSAEVSLEADEALEQPEKNTETDESQHVADAVEETSEKLAAPSESTIRSVSTKDTFTFKMEQMSKSQKGSGSATGGSAKVGSKSEVDSLGKSGKSVNISEN